MVDKPDQIVLGKKFPGEKFSTIVSVDAIAEQQAADAPYVDAENTMLLDVYLANHRINDPVRIAMMKAFTKVRKATVEAFDEIFSTF